MGLHLGFGVAEQEEADSQQDHDDADLERGENAGDGARNALVLLERDGKGRGFKESPAGFGLHVGGEFLVGA